VRMIASRMFEVYNVNDVRCGKLGNEIRTLRDRISRMSVARRWSAGPMECLGLFGEFAD